MFDTIAFSFVKVQKPPSIDPKGKDFQVIAMYDYPGIERGDLPLQKDQKVTVFDDSRDHWWRARNEKGYDLWVGGALSCS